MPSSPNARRSGRADERCAQELPVQRQDHGADVTRLTLPQVVIGGVIGAILFVATLVTLVYFITH
jgi:hypothetical protein